MTHITLPRATVEQALEALRFALHVGFDESSESQIKKADKALRQHWSAIRAIEAALAQQAEPVQEPVAWVGDPSTQDYASTVPDPQIEDRLARHGIQACLYPNCVGGQNGTICKPSCPGGTK